MEIQRLYSYVRRAMNDYHMVGKGDKIAVGISGGKDSLALLYAMAGLRKFYPEKFEMIAVTVDLGFEGADFSRIYQLCEELKVDYYVVKTQIGKIVFEERKETSACALCSKMRKGALNDFVMDMGCSKVAYAHHMDDIIETMLMSLIYEGRFYTFAPVIGLERTGLKVIRPLMYVSEAEVTGFINRQKLQPLPNPCPMDKISRRAYIKQLLQQLNRENPGVKKRLFHAILTGNIEGWTKSYE